MTPARDPMQELAEVISAAMNEYVPKNLAHVLNDEPSPGMPRDYIARAVAAYLARPETEERMADAAWRAEGGPAWETCGDNYRAMMRAAIAAVVGEAVNG